MCHSLTIYIYVQRWIQLLYIYIAAYCQSVMLPYTTGLKGNGMYLFRNVNGLLEKTSINTFPGKCQDDVQAFRFSKTMYRVRLRVGQHCLYSCQNILFRSVNYFDILFRGVNEMSILTGGVSEWSIIFEAVTKLNILFQRQWVKYCIPGVNEYNILFSNVNGYRPPMWRNHWTITDCCNALLITCCAALHSMQRWWLGADASPISP